MGLSHGPHFDRSRSGIASRSLALTPAAKLSSRALICASSEAWAQAAVVCNRTVATMPQALRSRFNVFISARRCGTRFRDQSAKAVYSRFREKGRLMPHGLEFVGSWGDSGPWPL